MKNSAPSAGPRKLRMPPITTIASSSPENATEIGSAEAKRWLNTESTPASAVTPAETAKASELVAVGRIADEARALLVLADRDEHAADRRVVEAPQQTARPGSRPPPRASNRVQGWLRSIPSTTGRTMPPSPFSPPVTAVQRKATAIQHAPSAPASAGRNRRRGGAGSGSRRARRRRATKASANSAGRTKPPGTSCAAPAPPHRRASPNKAPWPNETKPV